MNNLDSIFLFILIFSVLTVFRTVFRFIGSLLQKLPVKLVLSNGELITLGLAVTYCLTYLIQN
jgi:uncharacterized protein YacL